MIPVANIYHMLAYAFSALSEAGYRDMAAEQFDNAAELCAAILERGIESQVKRGLGRQYADRTEALMTLRGRIDVTESMKTLAWQRRRMVCSFDEFTVDSRMNRIIKATVALLLRSDISKARKKSLRNLMVYFSEVGQIDVRHVDWSMPFDRNNRTYRMLMGVCWLVAKGLLQAQSDGSFRMMDYFDDQRMCRLYEKFLLEYYRKEHPLLGANAGYIDWSLDDGFSADLPAMQSDIMLTQGNRVLIIDAKYYSHTMQQRFERRTLHSGNLYQIFAYVKNKEAELVKAGVAHEVSGLLLYARTDEDIQPDGVYQMSGNRIGVKTLDLNQPFEGIRAQLDAIVECAFGI